MEACASYTGPTERMREVAALTAQITELAGYLNAATYRFLTLIAEFDRRKFWGGDGATHSCAHWLNWKCGIAMGAAREKVRTARALENLPLIAASMERGELSYSKVRALTRVASPATEKSLLNIALHGTAWHVEKTVGYLRRCLQAQDVSREALQQKTRSVRYYWDDDGSLVLKARLPAEIGAIVLKAFDTAIDDLHGKFDSKNHLEQMKAGNCAEALGAPSWAMKRADALGVMAETLLKHGADGMNGGDRQQIIVHVSAETSVGKNI